MSAPSTRPTKAELRRTLPLSDELPAVITRMRDIVARSGDALLLADGPPDPDWRLQDECAEALHHLRIAETAYAEYCAGSDGTDKSPRTGKCMIALFDEYKEHTLRAKGPLVRAGKLRATTPAGIFAKALVVRASKTGTVALALSLAEDMVACQALRATLWPAGADL